MAEVFAAAHRAGNFDGVAVMTVDGETVMTYAVGFSDRQAKTPIQPETVFRLGSLTKQVTALLVMQQVDAGRIQLEQKAGSIMKSLPEASGRVTIRQLLSHVSGLRNPSDGPDNKVPDFYLRTDPSAEDMKKSALGFCSGKPKREPGGQFEYNNCDYILLGALLESLSGKSYAELVSEHVIQPLDLKSWVVAPSDPKRGPATAVAYQADGSVDAPQNPATYGAAGARRARCWAMRWTSRSGTTRCCPTVCSPSRPPTRCFAPTPSSTGKPSAHGLTIRRLPTRRCT